jgi:hypothetical protein
MEKGDRQQGKPETIYTNTKANIEALASSTEGMIAYATDSDIYGVYVGNRWEWAAWMAKDLDIYVAKTGDDSNPGTAASPLLTIQAAVNRLKGRVASNVTINVGVGTYVETVTLSGIQCAMGDLNIIGDSIKTTLGFAFINGWTPIASANPTNSGSGAISLGTDNNGTGERIRITAMRTITNPDFGADGIDNTNYLLTWNGTVLTEYQVYSVSGNVITLASTDVAPNLSAYSGRYFVVCPNVKIDGSASYAILNSVPVYIRGLYCKTSGWCLYTMSECCTAFSVYVSTGLRAATATGNLAYIANKTPPITVYRPNMFIGSIGLDVGNGAIAFTVGNGVAHSIGASYSVYVTFRGFVYMAYTPIPVSLGTGAYAGAGAYIYASVCNAINWASTKWSPAASDTLGNSMAAITFS